jgi:CheY-like chemotaxis protein
MGKATVLVITDVADERSIYTESLRAAGFSAEAADGPHEAFALATRQPPDIAVLRIPQRGRSLGGLALLHCLKQHEATSHIPVVVITSFMQADVRAAALAAGCDGYLLLPVIPDRLIEEVRRLLSRRPTAPHPAPTSFSTNTPPSWQY